MTSADSLRHDLAGLMQRALLPPRFPVRRDLEVESGIGSANTTVSFYDHIWVETQIFAAAAIRVHQTGLDGAWTASGLRQMLRALLTRISDPHAVLATVADLAPQIRFDAALARLDVVSGQVSIATKGEAGARLGDGTEAFDGPSVTPGSILWLTAGEMPGLSDDKVPIEGLEGLVKPALQGSAGVGCAVLYKTAAKSNRSATFVMTNDLAGIPPLLEDIGRFFLRQSLDEEAVAGLDVALDEILTNAVNYGYKDGNAHEILVSLSVESGLLSIEVRDDGGPFDPLSVPEPDLSVEIDDRQIGGLGMHFVRTLLDRVEYKRSNGWNVLLLEKNLPPAGGNAP
ncbi:hypothetical protein DEM27_13220 [Metarhizobium album]|uniref:Histidine kinase/HSP90-like ATPase domain-containing protein n=2 Tax=Metarhizobium album TaxID=2182425 RepID=A0A2U2DQQ1_9HYPH|nr:hypothetical protein DEM27_13220 [Rhizobium album]